ncbi:MAG: outer membrane protein assembly factor BamB family protein [Planctomycetota bacterium]|jgi:outer membrane protein assembly factor BamB
MRANNYIAISILVLSFSLMPARTEADDWPNWRGPQHDGVSYETDWIGDWAAFEPVVLWEQQVGTGFSSIVVADGRLFTMGNSDRWVETAIGGGRSGVANKLEETDEVFCLDPNTGEILWIHPYPSPLVPNLYEGGPSATPTVADDKVYTFSKQGMAYCFDANDGAVLWQADLVADYGALIPRYGFAGSPYVDANLVIYNAGTHGMALNATDGTLVWETGTGRAGYSTPVPFDFEGQQFLVLMGERTFAAVQAQTGQVLWEHPWVTRYNANIPDPVVDSNLVFVSTGYNEGAALFDVATGQAIELWFQKNIQTFLNTAVLWQGCLYGPNDKDKTLTCLERDTGWTLWTQAGFGNGSVMLANGKLIALSEDGELCIAEASPAGYRELGKGRILTGRCWSVPILANGRIYARNAAGHLVCVELMPAGQALPIRLAAYWNLDETEGDIANNSAGAEDGVLFGGPQWRPAAGKSNGALEFDGIDDYVSTAHIMSPADGDFSVFAWIKGGAPGQVVISQEGGANWLMTDSVDGTLKTDLRQPGTTGRGASPPGPPLSCSVTVTDGEWRLIGFVRDGSNRILYADGIEVARDTAASLESSGGGLYIGAGANLEPGSLFSGLIDDVRIYQTALSAEEVAALTQ